MQAIRCYPPRVRHTTPHGSSTPSRMRAIRANRNGNASWPLRWARSCPLRARHRDPRGAAGPDAHSDACRANRVGWLPGICARPVARTEGTQPPNLRPTGSTQPSGSPTNSRRAAWVTGTCASAGSRRCRKSSAAGSRSRGRPSSPASGSPAASSTTSAAPWSTCATTPTATGRSGQSGSARRRPGRPARRRRRVRAGDGRLLRHPAAGRSRERDLVPMLVSTAGKDHGVTDAARRP